MNTFKLPDGVYDFLKKSITVVLPAGALLISALGAIWGWSTEQVVDTIGAVALFLGAVIGISNIPFQRAGGAIPPVIGDIQVVSVPTEVNGVPTGTSETSILRLDSELDRLSDGDRVTLVYREKPMPLSDI